uniref:HPr family phosphocarrier protein n=1 Tax=Staphylococcus hominis TaxID=1290 RepID=UPI0011A70AD1
YLVLHQTPIHPPPPTILLQTPSKFHSHIQLQYNPKKLNLKSIIPLITLPLPKDPQITIYPHPTHQQHPIQPITQLLSKQPLTH